MRQGFQLRFALAPVVIRRPVAREFLHRRELHALGLIRDCLLFGPLRGRDAATKVDECRLRNVDTEGADFDFLPSCLGHGGLLSLTFSITLSESLLSGRCKSVVNSYL